MGIASVALKALRLIPRYAFSDGAKVIQKARKATIAAGTKSIFGKGNEFALKNSKTKISAGWDALKKDALKTMNSKKGVWASLASFGKSLISKPKAGIRAVKIAAAKAGKTAGFWAKTGGALKGLGKAMSKLPIVGTIIAVGCEVPDIYDAFKRGGAWEGTKQIFKSSAKIVGFAAGTALGTVIGGPIGGIIGGLIGDMLVIKLIGGSYSENHPEETEETEQTEQTQESEQQEAVEPQEATSTQGSSSQSSSSDTSSTPANPDNGTTQTTSPESGSSSSTTNPSNPSITNPFDTGLNVPNPVSIGMNPVGIGMNPVGFGNPFGMGMNTNGFYDPNAAFVNSILQPGENIFLKYPMGYKFQYMG